MDPNVQVAFVSVLTAIVTTSGVVAVALVNNRKERDNSAQAGVEAGMDEGDILQRVLDLIAENKRLQIQIEGMRQQVILLIDENGKLRDRWIERDEDP